MKRGRGRGKGKGRGPKRDPERIRYALYPWAVSRVFLVAEDWK